jgi:hypothetical protein
MALTQRGLRRTIRRRLNSHQDPDPVGDGWKLWKLDLTDADGSVLFNPLVTEATDSVVFPAPSTEGPGTKVLFDPVRSAVRGGTVSATQWDLDSRGFFSAAFGTDTVASGDGSIVMGGSGGQATGDYSTVLGGAGSALASGDFSLAAGPYAQAVHSGALVVSDNTDPVGLPTNLLPTSLAPDEVTFAASGGFNVRAANGVLPYTPAMAGTAMFDAATSVIQGDLAATGVISTGVGMQLVGQLAVPAVGDATGTYWYDYTAPPGNLVFSGSQASAVVNLDNGLVGSGGGAFSSTLVLDPATAVGLTRIRTWAPGAVDTPDLVFPGLSLDGSGARMQFEWSTRSFRAGRVSGTQWDTRGDYSVAFGLDGRAQGPHTVVLGGDGNLCPIGSTHGVCGGGQNNEAWGAHSVCGGGGANNQAGESTNNSHHATLLGGQDSNSARASYSFVGGGNNVEIDAASTYSAIGGGGDDGADPNEIIDCRGAVLLGGSHNQFTSGAEGSVAGCGQSHTISGAGIFVLGGGTDGLPLVATGERSVVLGGRGNAASGRDSLVLGQSNVVGGAGSAALGVGINAPLDYSLVMSDSNGMDMTAATLASIGPSSWSAGFTGGFELFTAGLPDSATAIATVLANDDTAWSTVSDRNRKENIRPFVGVLDRLASLEIYEYNYIGQESGRINRGPMAQDWHQLFPSGKDCRRIETMELDAVVLAGIKELAVEVRDLQGQMSDRRARVAALTKRLGGLPGR